MCQVNQQDQSQQDKEHCSNEGDVVTPNLEEALRDKECQHHKDKPNNDFGTPISILQPGATLFGRLDTNEEDR